LKYVALCSRRIELFVTIDFSYNFDRHSSHSKKKLCVLFCLLSDSFSIVGILNSTYPFIFATMFLNTTNDKVVEKKTTTANILIKRVCKSNNQ
jgi:hypothetical protein